MMFWPLIVVVIVGMILLAVIAAGPRLFHGTRRVRESFWCPLRRREVSADFAVSEWDGARLAVEACTAFEPPTAIDCARRCLDAAYRRQWEPALPVSGSTASRDAM